MTLDHTCAVGNPHLTVRLKIDSFEFPGKMEISKTRMQDSMYFWTPESQFDRSGDQFERIDLHLHESFGNLARKARTDIL
jgi:hypothetical protein